MFERNTPSFVQEEEGVNHTHSPTHINTRTLTTYLEVVKGAIDGLRVACAVTVVGFPQLGDFLLALYHDALELLDHVGELAVLELDGRATQFEQETRDDEHFDDRTMSAKATEHASVCI